MPNQTIWTQAVTRILDTLNAPDAPCEFYRARFEAVGEDETAGNVFPAKIDCKYDCAQDSVKIDASVTVRGYVTENNQADLAADVIVLWAWRRVRIDPSLGQLVEDVYPDNIELGYLDKAQSDQVCVDITFRVEVEVDRNDPSVNKTWMAQ